MQQLAKPVVRGSQPRTPVQRPQTLRLGSNSLLRLPVHAWRQQHDGSSAGQTWRTQPSRRWIACGSASTMMQDPADVIPSAEGSDDDEDDGRPAETPVLVVGAGPVGLITSMYLARRGYPVQLIDKAPDPAEFDVTEPEADQPLILSSRCLLSLEELGAREVLDNLCSVSLKGRWWVAGAPPGHHLQHQPPSLDTQLPPRLPGNTASTKGRASLANMAWQTIPAKPAATTSATVGAGSSATATIEKPATVVADLDNGVQVVGNGLASSSGVTAAATRGLVSSRAVLEEFPGWNERYTRRVLVSRWQLMNALLHEAERLYGDKIQLYYRSEFLRLDWDRKAALVATGTKTAAKSAVRDMPAGLDQLDGIEGETQPDEVWIPFGLLVGADGSESAVREALARRRPRITDFDVQRPMQDTRQWKAFDSLSQVPSSGEVLPGMASHGAREYEYVYEAPGAPSLRLWVPMQGFLRGIIMGVERWETGALRASLQEAYGETLPWEWLEQIVFQTCAVDSPNPRTFNRTVQCSQFHASRVALVGDAAHAMTMEYEQGLSCSIEGVRVLNLVLKSTRDNIDKALALYSEVRAEDVHSMQQLEFFKRSVRPGLGYTDFVFRFGGWLGAFAWRSALTVMAVARAWMPQRFPSTYVTDRLWDARRGYSDLLKVVTRFAAVPFIFALVGMALAGRAILLYKDAGNQSLGAGLVQAIKGAADRAGTAIGEFLVGSGLVRI